MKRGRLRRVISCLLLSGVMAGAMTGVMTMATVTRRDENGLAAQAVLNTAPFSFSANQEQVVARRSGAVVWRFDHPVLDPETLRLERGLLIIEGFDLAGSSNATNRPGGKLWLFAPSSGKLLGSPHGPPLPIAGRVLYVLDHHDMLATPQQQFGDMRVFALDTRTLAARNLIFKVQPLAPRQCFPRDESKMFMQYMTFIGHTGTRWTFQYQGQHCLFTVVFDEVTSRGTVTDINMR